MNEPPDAIKQEIPTMRTSTHLSTVALAAGLFNAASVTALGATYNLIKTYQGDTFFDDWTY